MCALVHILQVDEVVFRRVFRELGLLEALVACLQKYANWLADNEPPPDASAIHAGGRALNAASAADASGSRRAATSGATPSLDFADGSPLDALSNANNLQWPTWMGLIEEHTAEHSPDDANPELQRHLGLTLLDALRLLVDECKENAQLLHTSGGVNTVLRLVERRESSARALSLMSALLLTTGIDEHLAALLQLPAQLQSPRPEAASDAADAAVSSSVSASASSSAIASQQLELAYTYERYALVSNVLQTVTSVLQRSHRARCLFQKATVRGFELLVAMIDALGDTLKPCAPPLQSSGAKSPAPGTSARRLNWHLLEPKHILCILQQLFALLLAAIRFEPGNAFLFSTQVGFTRLVSSLRQLGCFEPPDAQSQSQCHAAPDVSTSTCISSTCQCSTAAFGQLYSTCDSPVSYPQLVQRFESRIPARLIAATFVVRFLFDLSLNECSVSAPGDETPGATAAPVADAAADNSRRQHHKSACEVGSSGLRLSLQQLVHPGALVALLHLVLPAAALRSHTSTSASANTPASSAADESLASFVLELVAHVLLVERNVHVLAAHLLLFPPAASAPERTLRDTDLPAVCSALLAQPTHPLHPQVQQLFEQVASVNFSHVDLRSYLTLGSAIRFDRFLHPESDRSGQLFSGSLSRCPNDRRLNQLYSEVLSALAQSSRKQHSAVQLKSLIDVVPSLSNETVDLLKHFWYTSGDLQLGPDAIIPCGGRNELLLNKLRAIVSITTPRYNASMTSSPAYVEFDMGPDGFGCVFVPSLAPMTSPSVSALGSTATKSLKSNVRGGFGVGERQFPPNALSFVLWFAIEKAHTSAPAAHRPPLRLLTVLWTQKLSPESCVSLASLSVSIHGDRNGRSLVVCTAPRPLPRWTQGEWPRVDEYDAACAQPSDSCVMFPLHESLLGDCQWHHLALVLQRSSGAARQASLAAFLDAHHLGDVRRISYPQAACTPQTLQQYAAYAGECSRSEPDTSVHALLGTPPQLRQPLESDIWRATGVHLVEDALAPQVILAAYQLGVSYAGCMQATSLGACAPDGAAQSTPLVVMPLVAEEKLLLSLLPHSNVALTLRRIRHLYNEVDCAAIARLLALPSGENMTPIRLVHNAACGFTGAARAIGGALIGYLGIQHKSTEQ